MLAACVFNITGCHRGTREFTAVQTVPFESVNAIDLGEYIEGARYVQLQNHPESAFIDIDKLIVSGADMFLLDKKLEAVFCFDTTGKFRYRIQRVGKGPGEYQELDAIWVKTPERELWLQSFWPSKIMVYNFDGVMLREFDIRWSARDMVGIGNNLIAGYNTTRSNDGKDSLNEGVFLLDLDGESKDQALILGDSTLYWSVPYQRNFEEWENGALLLSQSDTIFRIDQTGTVSPDVLMDWGKLKCPTEKRKLCFNSKGALEAFNGRYLFGKDQLIAFGPVRIFRIFLETHIEMALADLRSGKGVYSSRITSKMAQIPLLNPIAKSDNNELIGYYDMSILLAMKESQANRKADIENKEIFHRMDSLVANAMTQDRPVLWFAKIKKDWLTKTF